MEVVLDRWCFGSCGGGAWPSGEKMLVIWAWKVMLGKLGLATWAWRVEFVVDALGPVV